MKQSSIPEDAQDAVLYMKDGKRKYGMLVHCYPGEHYHFISNNSEQMEIVPVETIDAIDLHLK